MAMPYVSTLAQGRVPKWAEWLVLGSLFALCLAAALTQEVNPFPEDGWFETQYRLFQWAPDGDNYTPIAAPAYLYFGVHALAGTLGLKLDGEFYLACLVQNLLVFLSGLFLYRTHRELGLGNLGLLVSAAFVVFIQSTLMAQAFWSENAVLFLMSLVVFSSVRIICGMAHDRRSLLAWSLLLGLSLGMCVITRVVPVFLLPGLGWLFWRQLDRKGARLASTTVTVCVIALVVGAMAANQLRFSRFELSNSIGRHLWQNISPHADEMLAGSMDYQRLKQADPAIAGKNWWEVLKTPTPGFENHTREEVLRNLSREAITSHPLRYIRTGIENTVLLPADRPWRLGEWKAPNYNPLHRDSMLPPLLGPFPMLQKSLTLVFYVCKIVWPLLAYGVLIGWMLTALIRRWNLWRASPTKACSSDRGTLLTVRGFLAFGLVVPLWVSCQIEVVDFRYLLPYLPVLALLMSITLSFWVQRMRGARR